jgi:hypothetical protein
MPTILSDSARAKNGIATHFAQLRYKQEILAIFSLLLVSVLFWIIISLFSSQQKTKITPELTKMAVTLNPTVNTALLDELVTKKMYTQSELSQFPIFTIIYDKRTQEGKIVSIDDPEVEQ